MLWDYRVKPCDVILGLAGYPVGVCKHAGSGVSRSIPTGAKLPERSRTWNRRPQELRHAHTEPAGLSYFCFAVSNLALSSCGTKPFLTRLSGRHVPSGRCVPGIICTHRGGRGARGLFSSARSVILSLSLSLLSLSLSLFASSARPETRAAALRGPGTACWGVDTHVILVVVGERHALRFRRHAAGPNLPQLFFCI